MSSKDFDKTSRTSSEQKERKYSISESVSSISPQKRPIFKNIVTKLQFASRLARAQRTSFEEENDVVADDQEIRQFHRQSSKLSSKRSKRPTKLTLRQLSQSLSRSESRTFRRNESRVSDMSANDEDVPENDIISDGIIHFWKQYCFDEVWPIKTVINFNRLNLFHIKGHPFLKVTPVVDIELVAKVMHKCWSLDVPKIVTLIISNKSHSTKWTNQRQIKNFQKGLIDVCIN